MTTSSSSPSPSPPPSPLDDATVSNPLDCPPLQWGIIGCGRVSHDFCQALKHVETATVVGCAARSIDSATVFADKHGIENACESIWMSFAMIVVMNNVLDNAERLDHRDTQTLLYT